MKMKLWKIVTLLLFPVLLAGCGPNPNDPAALLEESNLNLPSYTIELEGDNLERSASAWDSYDYTLKLNEPIDDNLISQLKELVKTNPNWSYNHESNVYEYHLDHDDAYSLSIFVDIAKSEVVISYMEWSWFA